MFEPHFQTKQRLDYQHNSHVHEINDYNVNIGEYGAF